MIVRLLIAGAALALAGCQSQGGCSYENCKAAIESCRVELGGGPTSLAVVTCYEPGFKPDWAKYCADACNNRPGNGALLSCIASKADACRDGGINNIFKVIDPCLDKNEKGPEKSCEQKCATARDDCDRKCGITRECEQCQRAGMNCTGVCPDAGTACLDCSVPCGNGYVFCTDSCPRAP